MKSYICDDCYLEHRECNHMRSTKFRCLYCGNMMVETLTQMFCDTCHSEMINKPTNLPNTETNNEGMISCDHDFKD
jgi:hypothetical protein